jgi:hypothetical protein
VGARRAIAGGLVALALLAAPADGRVQTPDFVIKAAYLYKFAPFVDWPSSAFASPTSPFRLCILGQDPFGAALDEAVRGHDVDDHPIEVHRLATLDGAQACQILYFGGTHSSALADVFHRLRGAPVLTVSDETGGISGGVIQFVNRGGHVRFTIDAGAAAANRVRISSKLMSLAVAHESGL